MSRRSRNVIFSIALRRDPCQQKGELMTTKTLKELHALAKNLGIRGYSTLSRRELERQLATSDPQKPVAVKQMKKTTPTKKTAATKPKTARPTAKSARAGGNKKPAPSMANAPAPRSTPSVPVPQWAWANEIPSPSREEQVESAKYATVMPGGAIPPAVAADLGEDIDNLPPVTEPTLCLLPQKPGVVHGYWLVPPGSVPNLKSLKLRLGRIAGETYHILDEFPLPRERGCWYFHLDESADVGEVYLQLGYYEPGGRFVTATRRGIARIPSLYASEHTDRLWWVSEEQFRAMYLRAGGFARGPHLGWTASTGSPGGAARAPSSERLVWPGSAGSRLK